MQSELSATPGGRLLYTMIETRHYRCEECDAEFVRGERKVLQKIDGGTLELGRQDLALCTDDMGGGE